MSTAVAPSVAPAGPQAAEVAQARVAVLVANYQVDVVVPTKFTIETFIDDLIGVLANAIDDENVDFTPPNGQWSLARPGEPAMPRWRSLADQEVVDGTLLMLTVVESNEVFTPLVEDITDALALINEREFAEFDAETTAKVGACALGAAAVAAAVLLSWSWTRTGSTGWNGLPALLLGAGCWGAAVFTGRRSPGPTALALIWSALALLFAGGAMLVPPAYGEPGNFAAPNIAAGAVIAAIAGVTLLRANRFGIATLIAAVQVCSVVALAAILATYIRVPNERVFGGVVFVALILLTAAPRIAVVIARIRPPDLPDPGNEVSPATLTDIFDAETPHEGEIGRDGPQIPDNTTIEGRARMAVTSLRGLIVAVSLLLAGGTVSIAAAAPGGVREIVLGVAVAGILVMRARWFPDRVQAVTLCLGAAAAVIGVAAATVGAYRTDPARLAVVAIVVLAAGAAYAAAMRLPGRRLSPVTRRVIDLVEYALILIVPVICFWIMGIYTAMRAI